VESAYYEDVERRPQHPGHLGRHRHAAAGQAVYDYLGLAGRQQAGQLAACLDAVVEPRRGVPLAPPVSGGPTGGA
jgi:hypothetical protein